MYSNVYQINDSGFTLFAMGTDGLTGIIYVDGDNEYLGLTLGTMTFDILNIKPQDNQFVIIDAEATLCTVGAYSKYASLEFLIFSIGCSIKAENGYLSIGLSIGFGFKLTFKLW